MVTPSFVNAHTHLAMNAFRGMDFSRASETNIIEDGFFRVERKLSQDDVLAFSRMGAYESILNGVGFVWDHYYFAKQIAEALLDTGLAGVVCPTLQDVGGPFVDLLDEQWNDTYEVCNNKLYQEKGIYSALGPHATDTVSEKLWEKIRVASEKDSLVVHCHLAQSYEEYKRIENKFNISPTRYLKNLGILDDAVAGVFAHGIFISESDFKLLDPYKHYLVFCPFSQNQFLYPANIMSWCDKGMSWVLATDCAASNDSMNLQKELRYVSGFATQSVTYSSEHKRFMRGDMLAAGSSQKNKDNLLERYRKFFDPHWLLSLVWSTPGSIHPSCKVGSIKSGALANIIIWSNDHPSFWPGGNLRSIAFCDSSSAIYNMMVAGNWVGKDGCYAQSIFRLRFL